MQIGMELVITPHSNNTGGGCTWYESLGNAFWLWRSRSATLHIIDSDLYFEIE